MQDIEANQRAPATSFVTTSDMALKLQLDKKKYKSKVRQMEENRQDYLKRWKAIRDYQLPYIGCLMTLPIPRTTPGGAIPTSTTPWHGRQTSLLQLA